MKLTAAARKKIKPSDFALPEKRAYPIPDLSHAANAESRVEQNGSPEEKARVLSAVHRKFPDMPKAKEHAEKKKSLGRKLNQ